MNDERYIFVPLTDAETGLPAVVRLDRIYALVPNPKAKVKGHDTLALILDADMHVLVRETPGEVLDIITDLYRKIERAERGES